LFEMRDNMVFPPQLQHIKHTYPRNMPMSNHHLFNHGRRFQPTTHTNPIQNMLQSIGAPNTSVMNLATRGMAGLSKTLNHVQQALKMAETITPTVKKYGPMVKNIPCKLKMLKALKDFERTESESESNPPEITSSDDVQKKDREEEIPYIQNNARTHNHENKGASIP